MNDYNKRYNGSRTEKKREEERVKGRERVLKLERKVEKGRRQKRRH